MYRTNTANVLVIGTGAAGLRSAIAAHEAGAEVVVIGKRVRRDAHTALASGGINAALGTQDPEDCWEQHFVDTLREGYFLGHPHIVETVVREAPAAILELADWGCDFARLDDGRLDQRFFGAHRWRRTCYAGDYSGRAVLHTLATRAEALGIPIVEDHYVSRLLVADRMCFGAFAFDLHVGERTAYLADRVALANYTEIQEGRGGPHGGVFLDVSHRGKELILTKLPRMYRQFIEYQMLDISKGPMEVAPTAHYSMGGLVVDPETHATPVTGLFAAGECTAGLHGANRLGGNSLTETVVYGRRAGQAAAALAQGSDVGLHPRRVIDAADDELDAMIGPGEELARPGPRQLRNL